MDPHTPPQSVPAKGPGPCPTGPCRWAYQLVKELERRHVGKGIVRLVQDAQVRKFNDPRHADKSPEDPARHLTGEEAVAALEHARRQVTVGLKDRDREDREHMGELWVPARMVEKCRQLVATGDYAEPPPVVDHDARLLPTPAGDPVPAPPPAAPPVRADSAADIPPPTIPGPAAGPQPGVVENPPAAPAGAGPGVFESGEGGPRRKRS